MGSLSPEEHWVPRADVTSPSATARPAGRTGTSTPCDVHRHGYTSRGHGRHAVPGVLCLWDAAYTIAELDVATSAAHGHRRLHHSAPVGRLGPEGAAVTNGPVALGAMSPGDLTRQPPRGLSRCAALFHARVQPFFTPFAWTVGPSHRLATARARVVLPRECWLTARSRGGKPMAKIGRFHQVGGRELWHIEEAPARPPAQGEVRVRVRAMGLNRADSMFMHGVSLEPPHLPATLGYEAAGIVTAIGAQVDPSWLNKRVSTIPAFSPN